MSVAVIHGNKTQGARKRALGDFKAGRVTVLVATDVAARGLDIEKLPLVVNFDLPLVAQDYIHRIGRTGRAGQSGEAISLATNGERSLLHDIQKLLPSPIERAPLPAFAASPKVARPTRTVEAPARAGLRRASRRSFGALDVGAARAPSAVAIRPAPAEGSPQGPGPPAARRASGWRLAVARDI